MNSTDKGTILLVDNDHDLTHALTKRLASQGFRCITADTGAQGLEMFQTAQVDLVVTDLNMPGGDGVMLAETIRRTSNVPIIFITGFRDDYKRRLPHIQNVTTLRKPFDSMDLIDLITVSLGEGAAAHALSATTSEDS